MTFYRLLAWCHFFLLALFPLLAAGEAYESVLVKDVPHVRQKPDFCGEACVEMVLKKDGFPMNQDYVFNVSGVDPLQARGAYTKDLFAAMKQVGFDCGQVWYRFGPTGRAPALEAQWKALLADLRKKIPSIVCMHFDDQSDTTEHFRLILGYDSKSDEVIYNEPALDDGSYLRMKRSLFLKLWPLPGADKSGTLIRLRCHPASVKAVVPAKGGFTNADYAQHMMGLKKKLAGMNYSICLEPPFVVIGNDAPKRVRMYADNTVKWAVTMLKQDYFKKDPSEIIDIFLFKDDASYEADALKLFGEKPTTPYGYYSEEHNALVMNIATGGGTLVHEIVHPYMRENFPDCPAWFNEGMGSLYEQCSTRAGHISGATNWRLAGLKDAIKSGDLPTFPRLLKTTSNEFYNSERGNNYAQARYLCYYLQEKKLLLKYYLAFVANSKSDPSGLETLKKVLGEDDMAAFQKKWEKYVMRLVF